MTSQSSAPLPYGALPAERQLRWQETELYSIVHFGINTFTGKEWGYGEEPPSLFNPSEFDANQWAKVCKASGLKGIILVCKHHDGFCLWPTHTTEHCIRNSPWKNGQGDMVAEVADACRRHGLKFGAYISPWDRNHAEYGQPGYVKIYHQQLKELLTSYGPLFEVWFDGANGGDGFYGGARDYRSIDGKSYYQWDHIRAMIREFQPGACMFGVGDIRFVGNEFGFAEETCWATFSGSAFTNDGPIPLGIGARHGESWMPAECDFPLRKGWFFLAGDDIRQPEEMFELYFKSVGRGGTMNIGLAPDKRGLINEDDEKSLLTWSGIIRETFREDLLRTNPIQCSASNVRGNDKNFAAGNVIDGKAETYWTTDDSAKNPELVFEFAKPVQFNVVEIMEHLPLGQRVDSFAVDVWKDGAWSELSAATSIGYKRLLLTTYSTVSKLRIRFTQTSATPAIAKVGLYQAPLNMVLSGKLSVTRDKEGWVKIHCSNSGLSIRHTLDGSEPDSSSPIYQEPFRLQSGGTVRAFAFAATEGEPRTPAITQTFGCDRSRWSIVSVSLDSPHDNKGCAGVAKMLDDDPSTYWHTFHEDKTKSAAPHEVVFDMGETLTLKGFTFMPRMPEHDGTPDKYEFYLSSDAKNWTHASTGEFSNIKANPGMRAIYLEKPMTGRFVKFVVTHVLDNTNYVVVAGIGAIPA